MTRTIHDISQRVSEGMPVWPGDPPVVVTRVADLGRGDDANVTALALSAHAGTHVDAPAHYLPHGKTVDQLPLEALIGPAFVADVSQARAITPAVLDALDLPAGTERLLLRTMDDRPRTGPVSMDDPPVLGPPAAVASLGGDPGAALAHKDDDPPPAVTADGARWITAHGLVLVGIDGQSIAAVDEIVDTHVILLSAGVIPLEGLDLGGVAPGGYDLVCLPLKVAGADGAPARAVLIAGSGVPSEAGEA